MADKKSYQAVVDKIVKNGKHGPYVVARCKEFKDCITFSLDPKVWKEDEWPEPGMCVVLTQLRKKRLGWFARFARLVMPCDEQ